MVPEQVVPRVKPNGHMCSTSHRYVVHGPSPHAREPVENESHIDERRDLAWAYKRLCYALYCQLVFWWNPNFFMV
ncbi:hypothetical protein DVH24_039044 [Malus domestica]|uniref:Uncharacterized protein n=1 Tax=Malus domestica TaxID=3750 RepID=A0A498K906_MALDO|nr:hypothetical protein DVH24_039044 [Malus domestica]